MIGPALAEFIGGPVMMVFAARSASGFPALGRAVGAHVIADGREIEIYVGARQWPEAVGGLSVGGRVALTFARPADYRAYQLKGPVQAIGPASAADRARSAAYADLIFETLKQYGVTDGLEQWMRPADLLTLRVEPAAVFAQTPGPGAGERMALS